MPDELKQIKILFHAFLGRMFDFELLSAGAEAENLFIQFAALLAAFNFILTILLVPRYAISGRPHAALVISAWHDEEFLIATTLAVTGFLSDRRRYAVAAVTNRIPVNAMYRALR